MSELPTPISDQDKLLSNIAIGTPDIEDLIPNSRQEVYLKYIALNGMQGAQGLPIPIENGGTGATTEADARINLGIGSLDNLTTNKKTNIVSAINELNIKILYPYSLYFNSSGTKATITLSDNAVNYDYIEIYYQKDAGNMLHTKIYDPNGKLLTLSSVTYYSNTLFLRASVVAINGKSVTWKGNDSGNGSVTGSSTSVDSSQVFSIVKIIGYK